MILDIKTKYLNLMTRSLLEREFCDVISLKLDKLPDSNFVSGMPLDGSHDFWHPGL